MSNKRLTDLNSITTLSNDDLLYIVDPSFNTSNKITFGDLIKTEFTSLSTQFLTVSAEVDVLVGSTTTALATDIAALSATFGTSLYPNTNLYPLQTRIANLSSEALQNEADIATKAMVGDVAVSTYAEMISTSVFELSTMLIDFDNEIEVNLNPDTIGELSLSTVNAFEGKSDVAAHQGNLSLTSVDAFAGKTGAEHQGNLSLTSVNTFTNLGVNIGTFKFSTPVEAVNTANLAPTNILKDSLRYIQIQAQDGNNYRLLLSAVV